MYQGLGMMGHWGGVYQGLGMMDHWGGVYQGLGMRGHWGDVYQGLGMMETLVWCVSAHDKDIGVVCIRD